MNLEYKVVQSQTPLFSDSAKLREVLDEEAKAGWQLLEKQDNYRIRLQRDVSHRANDSGLQIDAYRTSVGVSPLIAYVAAALFTVTVVSAILYLAVLTS